MSDTPADTKPAEDTPAETAPAVAAATVAADEAAAEGATAAEQRAEAHEAATSTGITDADADRIIDRMEARGLFDHNAPPPAATATATAETPAGETPETPPEPPRKYTLAEKFKGRHKQGGAA